MAAAQRISTNSPDFMFRRATEFGRLARTLDYGTGISAAGALTGVVVGSAGGALMAGGAAVAFLWLGHRARREKKDLLKEAVRVIHAPSTKDDADRLLNEACSLDSTWSSIGQNLPPIHVDRRLGRAFHSARGPEWQGNVEARAKLVEAAEKYEEAGALYAKFRRYPGQAANAFGQAAKIWNMPFINSSVTDAPRRAEEAMKRSSYVPEYISWDGIPFR